MDTSEFLKGYNEINRLIQENLEEIHQAYDVPNKYEFCHFFIEQGKISNNGTSYCYLTVFNDNMCVETQQYRKTPCFRVYKRMKIE